MGCGGAGVREAHMVERGGQCVQGHPVCQWEVGFQVEKGTRTVSETTDGPVGGWSAAKGSLGLGPLGI